MGSAISFEWRSNDLFRQVRSIIALPRLRQSFVIKIADSFAQRLDDMSILVFAIILR